MDGQDNAVAPVGEAGLRSASAGPAASPVSSPATTPEAAGGGSSAGLLSGPTDEFGDGAAHGAVLDTGEVSMDLSLPPSQTILLGRAWRGWVNVLLRQFRRSE